MLDVNKVTIYVTYWFFLNISVLLFSLNFFLFSQKARIDILTVLDYHWNFPFTAVVLAINNDATKVGKLINVHVLVKSTTSQCLQVPVLWNLS